MADIELILDGDSAGAIGALREVGDATDALHKQATAQGEAQRKQSEEMWKSIGQWAAAGAAAVTAFGVASTKAFMESDRATRQLQRAAGEYADVLEKQAAALQEVYAVDDDIIKQSQTLLTQWNGVGAATEETTTAILNYAAATGKDAVTATQELIRNVENGGVGLAKIGVHFENTGDKTENLKNAVAALNEKFGGAASADANSLHGNLQALSLAFEDFQEHVGKAISDFNSQYAITTKLTEALKGLDTFLFGDERNKRDVEYADTLEHLAGRIEHRKQLSLDLAAAEKAGRADAVAESQRMIASNEKAISQLKEMLRLRAEGIHTGGLPTGGGGTNKGPVDAKATLKGKYVQEETAEVVDAMAQQSAAIQAQLEEQLAAEKTMRDQARADEAAARAGEEKMVLESYKAERKAQDEHLRDMLKAEEQATKQAAEAMKKREAEWARAADAIGAAFVNALADQLAKLAEGGELDPAMFVGEILAATVGTAATIIGTAYGAPAVGAAIGNIAAMGIRAGASGISSASRRSARTYHDGGPIEAWPRMHSGGGLGPGEVPMIGLEGEYVMSREAVARNGGMRAVDAMAKGAAPRVVMNVSALDAKSIAELGERNLSKGIKQALRTGRGDFPKLLGAPR